MFMHIFLRSSTHQASQNVAPVPVIVAVTFAADPEERGRLPLGHRKQLRPGVMPD